MKIAQSRLTGQGQVSVPAEVRRRLGLSAGSILEWDDDGEQIVVRRAGRYSSEDVHHALFDAEPAARTLEQLNEGRRASVRTRRARR